MGRLTATGIRLTAMQADEDHRFEIALGALLDTADKLKRLDMSDGEMRDEAQSFMNSCFESMRTACTRKAVLDNLRA